MLRILLPPNLASTATRDAIAVKIELNLAHAPDPELLPALVALQRFGAAPAPVLFLQLSRAQLRELTTLLRGQPVFAWVNKPGADLPWIGPVLRGVSEHLTPPASAQPPATAPEPARPASNHRSRRTSDFTPATVDGSQHFLAISLPSRDSHAYAPLLDLLKLHGFRLEPSNRKWWLRDRHKTLNFLAAHLTALRDEFRAEFTPNFERNTARIVTAEIAADVTARDNSFEVNLGVTAGQASPTDVQQALQTNRGYLESGEKIYLLDRDRVARVTAAQQTLTGEPTATGGTRQTHRVTAARAAEIDALLEELAPGYQSPAGWRERSAALRDLTTLQPAPFSAALAGILRPYQQLGVAWLWHLHRNGLGGVLADEMGLGKTLQALALLAAVQTDRHAPALVVAPASLLENWRREALRFTPELRTFVHHGTNRLTEAAAESFDLVITSYGTLTRDARLFAGTRWVSVVADEAQHIKNRRTRNAKALRGLDADSRFLLTGTPIENSLDDLRSLFEFLLPGFLKPVPPGLRADERRWHDDRLRAQTAPYLLRRTKIAVAPELPEKIEQVIHCELLPEQAELYRRTQEETERALFDLDASGASEQALRLATLTQLLRLRQVCCDPRLVTKQPEGPDHSTKLAAFRELLDEIVDEGHRVLVFSQFTSLLALLRAELDASGVAYAYLDGSMPAGRRQAAVDAFQGDESIPVFLLSLKAGGTGLNLTGADTVIHFDPWWNPAVEAQATDRAHRIGQTRTVTSYKLICAGTVEEKVLALQESKRALLADVFEASDAAAEKLELADLRELLRA